MTRPSPDPSIEVVVDELVLDGVRPDDPLVAQAIERALAPALAAHGDTFAGEAALAVADAVGRHVPR